MLIKLLFIAACFLMVQTLLNIQAMYAGRAEVQTGG